MGGICTAAPGQFGQPVSQYAPEGHAVKRGTPTMGGMLIVSSLLIASVLALWGLYALSGAGIVRRLPFTRTALSAITGIYLLRGIAFVPLQAHFPGNSAAFWYWSSGICLCIGLVHLAGLRQAWTRP